MRLLIGFLGLLLLTFSAQAEAPLTFASSWARASAGVTSAAYGIFHNTTDKEIALVAAHSPAAKRVEFHTHEQDSAGVMRMRRMETLSIPAQTDVTCEPGGLHIMLIELTAPLEKGKEFPLFLETSEGQQIKTLIPVR